MGKLNKESSVPLYRQPMEVIQNQMLSGELKGNDGIPTEIELSREYDVSRIMMRKAVELLVGEEILVRHQGVGTFASQKELCRNISGSMGFTQSCLAERDTAGAQLVSAELAETTIVDAEELEIQEYEKTVKIVRARTCDGIPVMPEGNHFPICFARLLGYDLTGPTYQILVENGVITDNGTKRIGVCQAGETEYKHLDVGLNGPLLYVKDVSYNWEGDPVHNYKSVINPDHYKMTVMVNA